MKSPTSYLFVTIFLAVVVTADSQFTGQGERNTGGQFGGRGSGQGQDVSQDLVGEITRLTGTLGSTLMSGASGQGGQFNITQLTAKLTGQDGFDLNSLSDQISKLGSENGLDLSSITNQLTQLTGQLSGQDGQGPDLHFLTDQLSRLTSQFGQFGGDQNGLDMSAITNTIQGMGNQFGQGIQSVMSGGSGNDGFQVISGSLNQLMSALDTGRLTDQFGNVAGSFQDVLGNLGGEQGFGQLLAMLSGGSGNGMGLDLERLGLGQSGDVVKDGFGQVTGLLTSGGSGGRGSVGGGFSNLMSILSGGTTNNGRGTGRFTSSSSQFSSSFGSGNGRVSRGSGLRRDGSDNIEVRLRDLDADAEVAVDV